AVERACGTLAAGRVRRRVARMDERAALGSMLAEQEELRAAGSRDAEANPERGRLVRRERHGGRGAARDRVLEEGLALRKGDCGNEECCRDGCEEDAHARIVGIVSRI